MPRSETIRARVEPDLKEEVEQIFRKLGLTTTEAISLFYHQVKLRKRLPFEVRIPNEKTLKTFADTDAGKNLVYCEDAEALFNKLEIQRS
jgi:DNA-damage-inducible protein J